MVKNLINFEFLKTFKELLKKLSKLSKAFFPIFMGNKNFKF